MAQARTPDQLAIVLGSINKIADPAARLSALRDLESEAVQGESSSANISAVDKAMGGPDVIQPAAYTALLGSIRQSAQQANAATQKGTPPASMTQPAAAGSLDATKEARQAQKDADSANFENQRLALQNQGLQQSAAHAAEIATLRQEAMNNTITWHDALDKLNTIKAQVDQEKADNDKAKALAVEKETQRHNQATEAAANAANATNNAANATNLMGHEVSQADSRATNAGSMYNNALTQAGNLFKGAAPGQGSILANGFQALLNGGQDYVANTPGAAPVPFTQSHFQGLLNLIKSGQVPPDANGNVVPNALRIVAGQSGVIPAAPNPNIGATTPMAVSDAPQFTAPDAMGEPGQMAA